MEHVEEQIVEEIARLKAMVPDSEILNHLATFRPLNKRGPHLHQTHA
jgi:hypothetical protein